MEEQELSCLFSRGQLLKHVNTSQVYEVQKTPKTNIVNGVPSYQLEQIDLTARMRRSLGKPLVFHRTQQDTETFWEPYTLITTR